MFCLRSWVPLLIFLTNASPIYVLLFLSATYALQRPCVYCSILLFVLVVSLFDFHADWFEPRWALMDKADAASQTWTSLVAGNATIVETLAESAGLALSALNGTGGSLASAAMDEIKSRLMTATTRNATTTTATTDGGDLAEWLRNMLEKRQFHIPCVDVIVRL